MTEKALIRYPEKEKLRPRSIITCHLDLKYPLRPHYWVEGERLRGTHDDLTPAFIVLGLLGQLKSKVFFTNDEETTMKDAQKVARWIKRHYPAPSKAREWDGSQHWYPTVIVCDVTEENKDCDVSIENPVFFDAATVRTALATVPDVNYRVVRMGGWDEVWRFAEAKLPAFSLALPIYGDYHSYSGYIPIERIEKYKKALLAIDKELNK